VVHHGGHIQPVSHRRLAFARSPGESGRSGVRWLSELRLFFGQLLVRMKLVDLDEESSETGQYDLSQHYFRFMLPKESNRRVPFVRWIQSPQQRILCLPSPPAAGGEGRQGAEQ